MDSFQQPAPHPPLPFPYRRVAVIGCPGSGKSTFSRRLHDLLGLPLHHLDLLYWNSDRTTVSKEEFRARLQAVIETDHWIIDGNYSSTMELRLAACDAVFFLDYPTEVCLMGIRARQGQVRSDLPWVETSDDADFLDFVRRFAAESKPQILDLLAKYPQKAVMTLHSREEADRYLAALTEE